MISWPGPDSKTWLNYKYNWLSFVHRSRICWSQLRKCSQAIQVTVQGWKGSTICLGIVLLLIEFHTASPYFFSRPRITGYRLTVNRILFFFFAEARAGTSSFKDSYMRIAQISVPNCCYWLLCVCFLHLSIFIPTSAASGVTLSPTTRMGRLGRSRSKYWPFIPILHLRAMKWRLIVCG